MNQEKKSIHKSESEIQSFLAGDHTILKEILHPENDHVSLPYSIAQARIETGKASLPHVLKSTEVYYFLAGKGEIFIGEKCHQVSKGDIVLVPPTENQYVKNNGVEDLVFLCIVSPYWKAEDEIIF